MNIYKSYVKFRIINWLIFVSIVKRAKKVVDNYFVGTKNNKKEYSEMNILFLFWEIFKIRVIKMEGAKSKNWYTQ